MTSTLILGRGYVGSALTARIPHAEFTHSTQLQAKATGSIYFSLEDRSSWRNLPPVDDIIWTFPAAPLDRVREFHQSTLQGCKRLLVYGSTSCYLTGEDDETVTEDSALNLSKERVQGEEYLRQNGATLLVLSGIYGPGREPVEWLRKGRIGSLQKRVNLIHRDDIVAISAYLLAENRLPSGERINLSDGQSCRWSEIAEHFSIAVSDKNTGATSKRVSNTKLRRLLPGDFQFRTLY